MAGREVKEKSIRKKLFWVVLVPIIVLGVLVDVFGMAMIYSLYTDGVKDELESTTNVIMDCMDLTVEGDYSYHDNSLYKGDKNITDFNMVWRIKEESNIDITIFWQDTRIVTTVNDEYGVSTVGTKASDDVIDTVLNSGKEYYSSNIDIGGVGYIGYYKPMENSGNSVVGMIFAGKPKKTVYDKMFSILFWFMVMSITAALVAFLLSRSFSDRMVKDINAINDFLRTISEGNLSVALDERVSDRNDELGAIGIYASKMKNELRNMVEMDPLTSLFNRRSCNIKLKMLEKEKSGFSLVMCDIDFFKKINDNYGHDAGDYILVTISSIIQDNVKDCGFASRWGGEEFLLVYRLAPDETLRRVELLKKNITEYNYRYNDISIKVTMTFGVETGGREEAYEKRIKTADDRLYIGKNSGRNRIIYKNGEDDIKNKA